MEEPPLPPTAQVVADIIGRQPTLALAKNARYRAMYVPYHIRDNHWIARTVGRKCADLLSRHLGGLHLPLAKCEAVSIAERNAAMRTAFRAGKTIAAIAADFHVSERTVFLVLDPAAAERGRKAQRERMARLRAIPGYVRPDRRGGQK